MSKGITKGRPQSTTTCKLMVTIDDSGDPATVMDAGTEIEFKNDIAFEIGDEVEFSYDQATQLAVVKMVTTKARVITSDSDEDMIIGPDEVAVIKGAKIDGKIVVNGGKLAIFDSAIITGKVQSLSANSYILASGATFEGKVESSNGGYLSLYKCTVFGKVVSDKNEYVGIIGSTINGKIDVTNAKKYINR